MGEKLESEKCDECKSVNFRVELTLHEGWLPTNAQLFCAFCGHNQGGYTLNEAKK